MKVLAHNTCSAHSSFERGIFDITPWVDYDKKNLLAIRILPPNNPGIPHEANKKEGIGPNGGALCLDGPTFISSEGWDWIPGIRDRNMGIWQDVRIKFGNELEIADTHVITDLPLPDTTSVNFIVQAEIYNSSKTTCTANLHFNIGDVVIYRTMAAKPFDLLKDSKIIKTYDVVAINR